MKLLLILASVSCFPLELRAEDYQRLRIVRNLQKVKSFEGTLIETGVVSGQAVKTDVVFERPNRFAARIAEPVAWAGTTVNYDGRTLTYHYPRMGWAIRFDNLSLPHGEDADRLVEHQYDRDIRAFDYRIFGTSKAAGLPVVTLWHEAKSDATFNRKGWTKVHDRYSFPIAGESHFRGADYGYRFESIEFNGEIDDGTFSAVIPPGTIVSEFDLAADGVEERSMRSEAHFEIVLPEDSKALTRTKIVRMKGSLTHGPMPAFAAKYDRGPHFLLVIAGSSMGPPPPYGLEVDTGAGGRLILGTSLSSYAFALNGASYTLLGNVPYEELLSIAQTMSAQKGSRNRNDRNLELAVEPRP